MHKVTLPKILQPFKCHDLIRLGKNNDGGYLINQTDINKSQQLVVFGLGTDCSYEIDFLNINTVNTHIYDQDTRAFNAFEKTDFQNRVKLVAKNVGNKQDEIPVYSIFENLNQVFFKCDIEGNEYEIIDQILLYDNLFTGMVIEFHDISQYENFNKLSNFIAKTKLKLVHLHVNNYMYYKTDTNAIPDVLELTFTSSSNIVYDKNLFLPHSLDMPNNVNDLEFLISF